MERSEQSIFPPEIEPCLKFRGIVISPHRTDWFTKLLEWLKIGWNSQTGLKTRFGFPENWIPHPVLKKVKMERLERTDGAWWSEGPLHAKFSRMLTYGGLFLFGWSSLLRAKLNLVFWVFVSISISVVLSIVLSIGFWLIRRRQSRVIQQARPFCSYCGRELLVSSRFCDGCGKPTS